MIGGKIIQLFNGKNIWTDILPKKIYRKQKSK